MCSFFVPRFVGEHHLIGGVIGSTAGWGLGLTRRLNRGRHFGISFRRGVFDLFPQAFFFLLLLLS